MKTPFVLAGFFVGLTLSTQMPAQSLSPDNTKRGLCSVSGTVVKLGDNTPLRKAVVQLLSAGQGSESSTIHTGDDGKFVFDQILPGSYKLVVTRNGYVTQEYGQKRPSSPAAILSLAPGQRMADLVFKLMSAAVITGHIRDEGGEPMPWVHIVAYRLVYYNGKRGASSEAETSTNDLGEYRLFGLTPGRYFLAANYEPGSSVLSGRHMMPDDSLNPGYVVTYYPNTNDPAKAAAVSVKGGDEINSIDVILSPSHVVTVRGRVFSAIPGVPSARLFVSLQPRAPQYGLDLQGKSSLTQTKDGSFEISNVPPGSYLAQTTWFSDGKFYQAMKAVDVGAVDVDGITLTIGVGQEIHGRIIWEGKPETEAGMRRISLMPLDVEQSSAAHSIVKSDGSFVLSNVPDGRFLVVAHGIGQDAFVKSVRYGDVESPTRQFTAVRGSESPLEVVISARGAHVEGIVTNADSLPAVGVWAVLVPETSRRDENWLFKQASTDQNGRFEMRGIPPGQYKLFSWDQIEEGAWQDPEFLRPFEGKGQEITVQEGDRKKVELSSIKAASGDQEEM
jgi:hypothetical protein